MGLATTGDRIIIQLTQDKAAIIDARDFPRISKHSWCIDSGGYAIGWHAGRLIRMHRLVMKARKGQLVDHINRDKLDNRRANLRFCTSGQNRVNAENRSDNMSGHRGVFWSKQAGKWSAQISIGGRQKHLGFFQKKEQAIRAYRSAARKHPNAKFFNLKYGRSSHRVLRQM